MPGDSHGRLPGWLKGTGIYESIEMKKWLIQEGVVPADRMIVNY
jgi:hypothetical protein